MHQLDNPVWHALTGPQETVAEGGPLALRYQRDVAPFAALPDGASSGAWAAVADLVGRRGAAVLFGDTAPAPGAIPPGWRELFRIPTLQMVADAVEPIDAPDAEPLSEADVPEMLELIGRTRPGPFERRTIELGRYIGIRDKGALVAMAGERMRLPGYSEISAVCTDDAHRGRGLASALVRDLVGHITARGDTPILHVIVENVGAIRVYERLGFTVRRQLDVVGLRAEAGQNEAP